MRTFGFIGTFDPNGGAYGLGALTGSVLQNAIVTTRLGVLDAVHPTPHNGADVASLDGPNADLYAPADGIVMRNFPNIWVGPGPKVLYTDENGNQKIVQPGDLDRGGNELWLYHPGPFLLPDGSTALNAVTRYCHLAELPPLQFGQEVKAGDVIGRQGTTGVSTGEHLHWALQFQRSPDEFFPASWDDFTKLVDPCQFIGAPVTEPLVEGEIASDGLSLVTITGTVAQLNALPVATVTATVGGRFVTYVVGAPSFVNAEFAAAFPNGLSRAPVMVKK